MVGHKLSCWPRTMPEKQPAEPVKYLANARLGARFWCGVGSSIVGSLQYAERH